MASDTGLLSFRNSITSQWGEDGIIAEIFRRIGTENKLCVEFGAWDGKYLSNTWDLWHNHGWSAILIEGDAKRAQELTQAWSKKNLTVINTFVTPEGKNSIDHILFVKQTPRDLDLMSIDVDGDDFYIFKSLTKYIPRVLVIEFNPTIPPDMEIVQDQGEYFGASALAIVNLARQKGYSLASCTETNCIFVLTSEFSKLKILEPSLRDVYPAHLLTYVISSQDGALFLSKQLDYGGLHMKNVKGVFKKVLRPVKHPVLHTKAVLTPVEVFKK